MTTHVKLTERKVQTAKPGPNLLPGGKLMKNFLLTASLAVLATSTVVDQCARETCYAEVV